MQIQLPSKDADTLPWHFLAHCHPWSTFSFNTRCTIYLEVSGVCNDQKRMIQRLISTFKSAYTIYAFFEWSLIIYDVAFDSVTAFDFDRFELKVTQRPDKRHIEKETAWINTTRRMNNLLLETLIENFWMGEGMNENTKSTSASSSRVCVNITISSYFFTIWIESRGGWNQGLW